jgi:hypothetical protein
MFGQKEVESPKYPKALLINSEIDKPRKKRFQRFEPGPAAVHKVSILQQIVSLSNSNFTPS